MDISIPAFSVVVFSSRDMEQVARLIAARLCAGKSWAVSNSGYYEEVPALELTETVLGIRLCLVEQEAGGHYTLDGHFEPVGAAFKGAGLFRHDFSQAIAGLLQDIEGLTVPFNK